MNNIEALVKNLKALSLPMDAINTAFFTEDERSFFYRYCRKHDVKHSEETEMASLTGVADPMHY